MEILQFIKDLLGTSIFTFILILVQIGFSAYTIYLIYVIQNFIGKECHFEFEDSKIKVMNCSDKFRSFISNENEYIAIASKTNIDIKLLLDNFYSVQEKIQSNVSSLINIPLYIGLVGTFCGIIIGVLGINSNIGMLFEPSSLAGTITEQTKPITDLFGAVGIAMMASLVGLLCMIVNTVYYRNASNVFEEGKEKYFKFLRTEVINSLSRKLSFEESTQKLTETAGSLIMSAETLTTSADRLKQAFNILNTSDDSLRKFQTYAAELSTLTSKVETTLNKYDEYFRILNASEARQKWTKIYDALIADVKTVSESMQKQFEMMSKHVNQFVTTNKEVFDSIQKQSDVLTSLQQYADIQKTAYDNFNAQITSLNQSINKMSETENLKNQDIIVALKAMTEALKEIKEKK